MALRRVAGALAVGLLAACGGGGDGDLAAFCTGIDRVTAIETLAADVDPADVAGTIGMFERIREAQADLEDAAPKAVRADLTVVTEFVDDLLAGLAADPDAERPAVYDELRPRFEAVEAAGDRLSVYAKANCD